MDISIAHSSTAPTGTEIPATQLIINSSRELAYGTITSLTDGVIDNQYTYLSKGTTDITIDLTQKETVKGVQLGMFISNRYPYYPESVKFYGSNNGTDWDELSTDMYSTEKVEQLQCYQECFGPLSEIRIQCYQKVGFPD